MATKFSIITITRNNREGLKKTAESVNAQTFKDYEWIIIDGASTDGTQDDFGTYAPASITSEPDSGIYDAMNKGIDKASGDYLVFMNAGDRFAEPATLQKTKEKTGTEIYDLLYGDSFESLPIRHPRESGDPEKIKSKLCLHKFLDPVCASVPAERANGMTTSLFLKKSKPHTEIERGLFTHHQAIFYNRESLGKLRFDTKYKIAADYDLTLKFLKEKSRTCFYLPFPVCIFESGGLSQQQVKLGRDEQFRARAKAGVPFLKNLIITQKQKAASFLRRFYPNIYWKIRQVR